MTKIYMIFAGCVFLVFCLLEMKGVAMDRNQTAPKPDIYTSRGGSYSRSGSSFGYFSSK